ncbi:MAG TPA: 3-phosphoshikimate 1-carboxyvinyltransferase [Bacillota bacterium]|nr:3-phosphoshikimate 1-carboxyvinyltransferase [Bacillota bacterium]
MRTLHPASKGLAGNIDVPGDKSISHRAVMLASLANGTSRIDNFLDGEDCMATLQAFRHMGVSIEKKGKQVIIEGKGASHLQEPSVPLDFGNSGTTTRLMLGILSGLPFFTTIFGDQSLSSRPMDRVVKPLRKMGASIDGRGNGNYLPLSIRGKALKGIEYKMPVKSAQVKSALLLAGLFADGETTVKEMVKSRDHTEKMLKAFGADIKTEGLAATITSKTQLKATDIFVPGDISSAAFFLAAAVIVPDSEITLRKVGLNETRTGILDALKQMGADIEIHHEEEIGGERLGDITVRYSPLHGITIEGEIIPRLIDEIPVLALVATQAEGKTVIRNAEELKIKETDRILAVTDVLSTLGAKIEPTEDGMIIYGKTPLYGGKIKSYHDHRIAMMGVIASLIAKDTVVLDDASSINISYPEFFQHLQHIQ